MLEKVEVSPRFASRDWIRDYLKKEKFEGVVDIGGAQDPWAREFVHLYVDEWDPVEWNQQYPDQLEDGLVENTEWMEGSLDFLKVWSKLKRRKKFDFAICSHVIEHLAHPEMLFLEMPKVAKEGVIIVPHKTKELQKGNHWGFPCRGMIPHRWIVTVIEDTIWTFPKLSFTEHLDFPWANSVKENLELTVHWKKKVPYRIVTNKDVDYPDPQPAIDFYKKLEEGV
jgi:hypothetical protein